jgi:hypothetical protein
MRRWLALLSVVLVVLAAAGCGGSGERAAEPGTVTDLAALGELAAAVDADRDRPRLVLLLSPT